LNAERRTQLMIASSRVRRFETHCQRFPGPVSSRRSTRSTRN
jgi:hypothetical protein